jgi:hypothetical protein
MHSDKPNVKVFPFVHSKTNSAQDFQSFNVMWPTQKIKYNEGIYKDNLPGYGEDRHRSTRLHTWFQTPDEYFSASIKALRNSNKEYDVESNHETIQTGTPLRGSCQADKLRVFTEDHSVMSSLTDSRFELVSDHQEADVCWALGLNRSQLVSEVKDKECFVNNFPNDDVLLIKELLVALVHSTYKSLGFSSYQDIVPESYLVASQLPAFVGRFKELGGDDLAPVWQITSRSLL